MKLWHSVFSCVFSSSIVNSPSLLKAFLFAGTSLSGHDSDQVECCFQTGDALMGPTEPRGSQDYCPQILFLSPIWRKYLKNAVHGPSDMEGGNEDN